MSETKNDQVDINVKEMSQHVYQHPGEPRDFDYRVQAFAFALSITRDGATPYVIERAAEIEAYLRNGASA
jgi:hypothetical protein